MRGGLSTRCRRKGSEPGLKMVWRLFKRFEPFSCRPKRENLSRLPTSPELSDEDWDFRQDF
jgi:hypothetical protein